MFFDNKTSYVFQIHIKRIKFVMFMFVFFINMIICREYYIKLTQKELYLINEDNNKSLARLGDFKDKLTFIVDEVFGNQSFKILNVKGLFDYVLDNAFYETQVLIYYPRHGLKNQQFKIVPLNIINTYNIINDEKCLTWKEDKGILEFEICNFEGPEQIFEFICADCPSVTINNHVPGEYKNNIDINHSDFLNSSTKKIIRSIGDLVADISICFEKNGTCKALDNHHEKLSCIPSMHNSPNPIDIWPDIEIKSPHIDDIEKDLLLNKLLKKTSILGKIEKMAQNKHISVEHPKLSKSSVSDANLNFSQDVAIQKTNQILKMKEESERKESESRSFTADKSVLLLDKSKKLTEDEINAQNMQRFISENANALGSFLSNLKKNKTTENAKKITTRIDIKSDDKNKSFDESKMKLSTGIKDENGKLLQSSTEKKFGLLFENTSKKIDKEADSLRIKQIMSENPNEMDAFLSQIEKRVIKSPTFQKTSELLDMSTPGIKEKNLENSKKNDVDNNVSSAKLGNDNYLNSGFAIKNVQGCSSSPSKLDFQQIKNDKTPQN